MTGSLHRRHVLGSLLACGLTSLGGRAAADARGDWPRLESSGNGGIAFIDDTGSRLVLTAPLRRVVVFNRYAAEFVRAIAGVDVMVGVGHDISREADYWPSLHAGDVGQSQSSPNLEAIVALRPEAVFVPRNADWAKVRLALQAFGVPVVVLTAWDVLKHERNVDLLGHLFAQRARADALNGFYRAIRDRLVKGTADGARPRVYFEEVGAYRTVLEGSGWHDMIEAAGGENIFGRLTETSAAAARGNNQAFDVDPEEILARRPDVIVKLQPSQHASHPVTFSRAVLTSVVERPGFATTPAVMNKQVFHISYHLAGACSKIVGALQIASWLRPDQFSETEPEDAMRTWLEQFQGVPYPGGYWRSLSGLAL